MKKSSTTVYLSTTGGLLKRISMRVLGLFILTTCYQSVLGQEAMPLRRNTIKVDLTSNLLFRNAINFSYERVTKPSQTLGITLGYQQFPKITSLGSSIQSEGERDRTGYKVGAEYRFYLKKENKYQAPHGVYLGPYMSYLFFKNERDLLITKDNGDEVNATYQSKISVFNIGFQVGYQFVINDRWTIDLVFIGPSISRYGAKFRLDGNFTVDEEHEYQNEIVQALVDRFPGLEDLITDHEVDSGGKVDTWGYGYRYQVLFGYRFGHKK